MCGFAGVVVWDGKYRVSRETLTTMAAAIAHRGPDGQGIFLNHDSEIAPDHPQVGLAFRRLAILDPDPRSDQPFTDGRYWLVFNGEIYNFRELKKELSILFPDRQWLTTGDTEVLLAAYAAWGEKCVEKLNGMFAFAVWDEVEKTLFLARDRMGQKPLYVAILGRSGKPAADLNYHSNSVDPPNAIAFGSELGALAPVRWWDRAIDENHLALYLSLGYIIQGTIYRGVRQLEPSRLLIARASGYGVAPYAGQVGSFTSDQQARKSTRALIATAVTRQMVSDVPIGSFLSGGVDSAVVTAAMKVSGVEVQTFSMGFDDPKYDESDYAAAIATHLKTKHHRFHVKSDAAADLPKLAAVFGEPFADSSALPTHYLSREVRNHVKVALSGDGGDELFGGYDRYRAMRLAERFRSVPISKVLAGQVANRLPGSHPKSLSSRVKRFATGLSLPAHRRYASFIRIFDTENLDKLLLSRHESGREYDAMADLFEIAHLKQDVVISATGLDRLFYLPGDLLTKVDRCSMLHGLEVRSPFMDHELVTFAAGLTTDQLLKGGPKRMLREAFADDLPAWVFKRKKMGFAVPIGDWFRGPLREMLESTLFAAGAFGRSHFDMAFVRKMVDDHQSGRVDHSQRLYALLMLELWWSQQK